MAKSLRELKTPEALTRKRTRTSPATTSPSATPGNTVALAEERIKSLAPDIEPAKLDLNALAPKDLTTVSSALQPLPNEQYESDVVKVQAQTNRAKLIKANAQLVSALEDAKTAMAKSAQSAVRKGVSVQDIQTEIAKFDTSTERVKQEREKALQATMEREGVEALRPLIKQRIEAERARYQQRIARIEESTQRAIAGTAIDVNALEI